MEAAWPQITPELADPAQQVDFPQGGALLPPAGHGVNHMAAPRLQAARKCQERSSHPFCSTGQNCPHSPRKTYRTTCYVPKHPGGVEGQERDGGRGAFYSRLDFNSTRGTTEGPSPYRGAFKKMHPFTIKELKKNLLYIRLCNSTAPSGA